MIDIDVEGAVDLYGIQFDLFYDQSGVLPVSVVEGPFLRGAGTTSFDDGENAPGQIMAVVNSLIGAIPGATGNGILAVARFQAVNPGLFTFSLDNILLLDSQLELLAFDTPRSGAVNIQQASVPEPATIALMTIGGLILTHAQRRSSNRKARRV